MLPSEEHDPSHAVNLATSMRETGVWQIPIILERESLAVMDGHHRLAASKLLGLRYVPALLLDYSNVRVAARRAGFVVTPEAILQRARMCDLYPSKTTQHLFSSPIPNCNIALLHCHEPASGALIHTKAKTDCLENT
ncbi:hypothetical protein B0E51_01180 [Rhodanobacter sp. C05]|nr:hypothetical protein B0E51_01180 [Rhodanobacter sp. C05]